MRSMTGYGKGIAESTDRRVTVELRSVNHRFLDIATKLPRVLACCEDVVKKTIQSNITRGHVDVFVTYEDNRENKSTLTPDMGLAAKYLDIANRLADIGIENDLTASTVIRLPEVLTVVNEPDDEEAIVALAKEACEEACKKLVAMRTVEGENLKSDMLTKLAEIERLTAEVEVRAPMVAEEHGKRLRTRIEEALSGVEIDEARLLNEISFFVDKANVDEELTRLKSHIAHGRAIFEESGSVGKKLDFLVQEINREVNTTGSKSNDIYVTERVLSLKNEVEKLREQVQNIE